MCRATLFYGDRGTRKAEAGTSQGEVAEPGPRALRLFESEYSRAKKRLSDSWASPVDSAFGSLERTYGVTMSAQTMACESGLISARQSPSCSCKTKTRKRGYFVFGRSAHSLRYFYAPDGIRADVLRLYFTLQGWVYTGCTNNIQDRFKRHTNGNISATVNRRPLALDCCVLYCF